MIGEEGRQQEEENARINEHVCSFVRGDLELAKAECREGEVEISRVRSQIPSNKFQPNLAAQNAGRLLKRGERDGIVFRVE